MAGLSGATVTITVDTKDMQEAIDAIERAHAEFCIMCDDCDCTATAERLQHTLDEAPREWS